MSVPTKPQTFATWTMFFAARGARPGVETASHGRATLWIGSSGSSTRASAPAMATPPATRTAIVIRSRLISFLPEPDVVEGGRAGESALEADANGRGAGHG